MCTLRCSSPRPVHRHTRVHEVVRPLRGKEGDAQRPPLHPHQGVAGGGSEDGSGLVTSDVSSAVYRDGGLNQRVLVPRESGSDQDVRSNFVPG